MKKILLIFTVFSTFLFAMSQEEKAKKIDKEIEQLEDTKRGFESRALRYEDKAQDLQFNSNNLIDAKRYWRKAEIYREAAEEVEKKIKLKKEEKEGLLKKIPRR